MGMRSNVEPLLSLSLSPEPDMREELKRLVETARQCDGCDVVIDFSAVDIVTSASISSLLQLRSLLDKGQHRLVLCGLKLVTRGIIEITGLANAFEVRECMADAIATLQRGGPL